MEREGAPKQPAYVSTRAVKCNECDKAPVPPGDFCEDHQQTERQPPRQKCKACNQDAVPLSFFCEDHQQKLAHTRKKVRFRWLDAIAILGFVVLLWAYPKLQKPVWQTVGNQDDPSWWSAISNLFARRSGRDGAPSVAIRETSAASQAPPAPPKPIAAPPPDSAPDVRTMVVAARGACGNGIVEAGEQCDGEALAGASCTSLGFAGDCGSEDGCIHASLRCLADCRFDYSGCTAESQAAVQRFVDNGNGTATDRLSGLMWELKCTETACRERHDVVTKLPWPEAATVWVNSLNDERFAGHTDWRLPTLEELRTLLAAVPPCATAPCPVAAWPRERTAPGGYWSSTTFSLDRKRAWAISFGDGEAYTAGKDAPLYVRAVRSTS